MFEAIYKVLLKPNVFPKYIQCWRSTARYMQAYRGAIESRIYLSKQKTGYHCLIHSRWPNELFQQKSWPLPETAPETIKKISKEMGEYRASKVEQLRLNLNALNQLIKENDFELIEEIKSEKKQILLYNDEGCGNSVYEILDRLKQTVDLDRYRLLIVDAEYINKLDWEPKTQLFIMPGGRARPYYLSLGASWKADAVPLGQMRELKEIGVGNNRIKNFVEKEGGQYLGICAGAYYGANKTVFERGGELEVLDEGALKFFKGTAEGPAYGLGKFDYNSEAGAEIAEIRSQKIPSCNNLTVYFNGGCFLHSEGEVTSPENILAYYNNIDSAPTTTTTNISTNTTTTTATTTTTVILPAKHNEKTPFAAMVENQVGLGTAILSGVHFEHSSLSPRTDKAKMEELAAQDDERLLFFARIVNRLGVSLAPAIYNRIYANPLYPLEMQTDSISEVFSINEVERKHFKEVNSTQTYSFEQIDKLQVGKWLLVTADIQTQGKGTYGREWKSPEGNIYATFSTLIPKGYANFEYFIPQVTALSIAQVLQTFGLDPRLKWVNDVLLNNKKVAGILCNGGGEKGEGKVFHIGIGINVNMSEVDCSAISQPATSISIALGNKDVSKEHILVLLQQALSVNISYLFNYGYEKFCDFIDKLIAFKGESICFDTENEKYYGKRIIEGILAGVNPKGALLLVTNTGEEFAFTAGRILKGKELEQYYKEKNMDQKNDRIISQQLAQFGILSAPDKQIDFSNHHIHFNCTESTQDYLRDHADELFAKHGEAVVVTADEQTKGRGTQNRSWKSPPHVNIYATFGVILPNNPEKIKEMFGESKARPITSQIAALAVAKTLEHFGFQPQIKWRNDVLVNGKKICGILCEPIENMKDGRLAGIIGIGLNVNMSKEDCDSLDQPVTSMGVVTNSSYSKEAVFETLKAYVTHYIKLYFSHGFAPCRNDIEKHLAYVGKSVHVEDDKGQTTSGIFEGINQEGCLCLRLDNDELKVFEKGRILKEAEVKQVNELKMS